MKSLRDIPCGNTVKVKRVVGCGTSKETVLWYGNYKMV